MTGTNPSKFILVTDIWQSSRLMEDFPQEYNAALVIHNKIVEEAVASNGGQIYKNMGDGYIAFFDSAPDCLLCGLRLQLEFARLPALGDDARLRARLAVHGGALRQIGQEFFGPALNRASRICQVCNPGQVLISDSVRSAASEFPASVLLTDLGVHHLRDLAEPEHLFQLDQIDSPPQEFPPLETLGNRPNNLHAMPDEFIGRERELRELKQLLLDSQRLISITGLGGYGKSRLAKQVLADLLPQFERGAFFVELASISDPSSIPVVTARALGYTFFGSRPPDEQLIDYLRGKKMLICFDNFEHILEGRQLIADILKGAPHIKIVGTSREPLRIQAEQIYQLGPLPVEAALSPNLDTDSIFQPADALLLFADRAKLVNKSFELTPANAHQVEAICRTLSGIPLAIILAAAWMDTFTLAEMIGGLEQQLELEARQRDLPGRHRSLRASLDWSWNLLSPGQRETLMTMSTFIGGTFAEGASAVLGLEGPRLRQEMAKLMDKSWLTTRDEPCRLPAGWIRRNQVLGQTRWYLRDAPSREYVFEKLEQTRSHAPRNRLTGQEQSLYETSIMAHATYFSGLVARDGPRLDGDGERGQIEMLAAFEIELGNLKAAIDSLLQRIVPGREDDGQAALLAGNIASLLLPLVRWLWVFLSNTGKFRDLYAVYHGLCDQVPRPGNPELAGWATVGLCEGAWRLGLVEEEQRLCDAVLELGRTGGLPIIEAWALKHSGTLNWNQGRMDQALECYEQSLAICRKRRWRWGEGAALNGKGNVLLDMGQIKQALACYEQSLAIRIELGDRRGEGGARHNLASIHMELGQVDQSREYLEQSLELFREIGDPQGEGNGLSNLGILHRTRGNLDLARDYFNQSLEMAREMGDRAVEGHILSSLGVLHIELGNSEQARECFKQSLAMHRELGKRAGEAYTLDSYAELLLSTGDLAAAKEILSRSLQISEEIKLLDNLACLHPKWSRYWLLSYGESSEASDASSDRSEAEIACSAGVVMAKALEHLKAAKRYMADLGLNWQTEEGRQIELAQQAIIRFADENGLTEMTAGLNVKPATTSDHTVSGNGI